MEEKTMLWKRPMGEGLLLRRPGAVKAASLATHFVLGFVTGCVRMPGSGAPFGVAMTARAGGGLGGAACALGAALGYLASGGFSWALRYIASLILTFTASFLLREVPLARRSWFMPSASALILALTGALNAFDAILRLSVAVELATETALCAMGTYLFQTALSSAPIRDERQELRRSAGGILLLCCALMALARVSIPGVLCPGRAAACFCVMTAAFGGGASAGAFVGVVVGLAMDLAAGGPPVFLIGYGFAGLLSGAVKRQGRLLFLLVFLTAHALTTF